MNPLWWYVIVIVGTLVLIGVRMYEAANDEYRDDTETPD